MKNIEEDVRLFTLIKHVEALERLVNAMPLQKELNSSDDRLVVLDLMYQLKAEKGKVLEWFKTHHLTEERSDGLKEKHIDNKKEG